MCAPTRPEDTGGRPPSSAPPRVGAPGGGGERSSAPHRCCAPCVSGGLSSAPPSKDAAFVKALLLIKPVEGGGEGGAMGPAVRAARLL